MEQLSFDNLKPSALNYESIKKVLAEVEMENSLSPGHLIIKDNKSKNVVIGFSILLDTTLAAKINLKKCAFSVNKMYFKASYISEYIKFKEISNPNNYMEFEFANSETFLKSFKNVLNAFVKDFVPSERFGCCHRYVECSDAGKCIAPDPIHAKGCYYKENLENGRIFYGKNATIKNPPQARTGEGR